MMKRTIVVLAAVATIAAGAWTVQTSAQGGQLEKNKVLAQRFHLDMIGKGDLSIAEEIIAPDCLIHTPRGTTGKGPDRARQMAQGDHKRYPKGIELVHDIVLAEGNYVAFHWTLTGTMESGEKSTLEGIDLVRIANGKIAEMWIEFHRQEGPKPPARTQGE